ncbi:MAG: prolyl oligopeptidase [Flavobacteriaceae bacterium]|nr:MAG: prolyl oligopeptidase [Flavobacteriaceae bacterium]
MRYNYYLLLFILFFMSCKKNDFKIEYPRINKKEVQESFFGKKITDSYRNIENMEDPTIIEWFKNETKLSDSIINLINGKQYFLEKLTNDIEKNSYKISKLKITKNNTYFYLKKTKGDEYSKLYYRNGFSGKETLLFDPTSYKFTINYLQPSWDASKVAIGISKNDQEFSIFRIVELESKKLLEDQIPNGYPNGFGGIEWLPDNSGFIYTYVPIIDPKKKNYMFNAKSIIYKIGTSIKETVTIFSKKNNPTINFKEESIPIIYLSDDTSKIILGINITGTSRYRDTYFTRTTNLEATSVNWNFYYGKEEKIAAFSLSNSFFYYRTAKNASTFKICKTPLLKPDFKNPILVVDQDSTAIISDFTVTNQGVFYVKSKNGVEATLYHLNEETGERSEIKLPKASGYINVKSKGYQFNDLWIETKGWTSKKERYKYNIEKSIFEEENLNPIKENPILEDVIVEEIEIPSHDGIMVPLSIIYKKGIKKDKSNRLLINAYGSYKWSNAPYMYPYLVHWVNKGGIYAIAHVRGGGEKGDAWHKAGFKTTKLNTWKDLIACTEYFTDNNYVNKNKIVAWGASAGGVCIGRAITERPDLFSAAIIRVGILNTLRREFGANGANNTREYGTIKDSIEFKGLLEMDAYHHIKNNIKYPAVFLTAGLNDSRVPAWQPAKFAARLQEATASNKPVLLNIDFDGGHGFEASDNKKNEELAKIMSFAFWQTGHPEFQLKN